MTTNTDPVPAHDELRLQAALLRTPEFMAQFDPDKFAGQLERIAAALASAPPSGAAAYCRECQAVGMSNCAHFDECAGAACVTCHRPLNVRPPSAPVGVEEIEAVLHGVYMDHPDYRLTKTMIHDMATAVVQSITRQPAAIPRLANCGRYTATDNTGQHYYLNHANTWQAFQGQQPADVDEAMVERAQHYRLWARGAALAAQQQGGRADG